MGKYIVLQDKIPDNRQAVPTGRRNLSAIRPVEFRNTSDDHRNMPR